MKITKKEKAILQGMMIGTEPEVITNPFSKESATLCPEAVALYDIIKGSEIFLYNNPDDEEAGELFHTARDVFIRNWPTEYSILLD